MNTERQAEKADMRHCPATSAGLACTLRYDHDGQHWDKWRQVSFPRLIPPEVTR